MLPTEWAEDCVIRGEMQGQSGMMSARLYWVLKMESINDMGVYNGSKAKLIDLNGY